MARTTEVSPGVTLDDLKSIFSDRYATLVALRMLALNAEPPDVESTLGRFEPRVIEYLLTDGGRAELGRWQDSFSDAFNDIDQSYAEMAASADGERSVGDWLAGIQAEEIAIGAISRRALALTREHQAA